jgi:hypothetical protein
MHGKSFLLDAAFGGINEQYMYGRLDFADQVPDASFGVVVNFESWLAGDSSPRSVLRLEASVENGKLITWEITGQNKKLIAASAEDKKAALVALVRTFECRVPLSWLLAGPSLAHPETESLKINDPVITNVRLRFSLWQNRLPIDALPVEGWLELPLLGEEELVAHVV